MRCHQKRVFERKKSHHVVRNYTVWCGKKNAKSFTLLLKIVRFGAKKSKSFLETTSHLAELYGIIVDREGARKLMMGKHLKSNSL